MPARDGKRGHAAPKRQAEAVEKVLPGKEVHPRIPVSKLISAFPGLEIKVLAGSDGLGREIGSPRIQKPGLALVGAFEYVHPERVQVLGNTELAYLKERSPRQRLKIAREIFERDICCLLLTKNMDPPREFLRAAEETQTPLLRTPRMTSFIFKQLGDGLADLIAPFATTHGVLVDVYGVGLLIIGRGSIGKSECALDLVVRGHRLVSDDLVEIRRRGDVLTGSAPELLRHHMELRGVGIINIKDLFGVVATRVEKDVDLVVELESWDEERPYDRLGLSDQTISVLGLPVPYLLLPVAPGRNITILLEVAVRNLMLKRKGVHSAKDFAKKLNSLLGTESDES